MRASVFTVCSFTCLLGCATPSAHRGPSAAVTACRALVEAYAVHRDRVDSEAYGALFTDDAAFVFGPNRVQGRAAIVALMEQRARGTVSRHLMSTTHIEAVDDGEARGVSYFMVFSEPSSTPATLPVASSGPRAVIEYQDRFTRTPRGWRIAHREVRLIFKTQPTGAAAPSPSRAR